MVTVLTLLTLFTALRGKNCEANQKMLAISRTALASSHVFHLMDLRLRENFELKIIHTVTGDESSFHTFSKVYRDAHEAG